MQRTIGNAAVARLLARDPSADGADGGALLVDAVETPSPAQMQRGDFLRDLRAAAIVTARESLGTSPWQAMVDSSVEQWMQPLSVLDSAALERRIRRDVPAAQAATHAEQYISAICAQVRTTIQRQLSETDHDAGDGTSTGESAGMVASAAGSIAAGVSGAIGALGSILFKRRGAAVSAGGDAQATRSQLGAGAPLDGTTRARMEGALGHDFSEVRIHSDAAAATTAARHGALGFTIGNDVGFAAGAYRPGSVVGDALLAHELAHVAQQSSAMNGGPDPTVGALETDADAVASAAVGQLHGMTPQVEPGRRSLLRSGLRLMSCGGAKAPAASDPHGRYEFYLNDGASRLQSAAFGVPLQSDFEDKFNKKYWRWESDDRYKRNLQPRDGVAPSQAIREGLFESLDEWRVDCAHAVQLSHWWAQLNTLGDEAFNRQSPQIQLRPRGSTGIKTVAHYGRNGPTEPWRMIEDVTPNASQLKLKPELVNKDTDQLVAEAPIGARVRWTNRAASENASYFHENSLKLGADKFVIGGWRGSFTRREVEEKHARKTNPQADQSYIAANVFIDEVEHFDSP
jgi:hypothetical protein